MFNILHAQSHAFATLIDFYDTDTDVLMKVEDLCWVGDEAVGELRDVDESVLMNTDVDEGSEVGDVRHDTREFHSYDEVVEGMDVLVEFKDFNLSTWVAPWLLKFGGASPLFTSLRSVTVGSEGLGEPPFIIANANGSNPCSRAICARVRRLGL